MINEKHGEGTLSTKIGVDKSAENTTQLLPNLSSKPKTLGLSKKSLWVSLVRFPTRDWLESDEQKRINLSFSH